jgi:hypothetical protein
VTDIEARLTTLEAKVEALEGGRSGRKALPIVVKAEGICGVQPDVDSSVCPFASLYRRQQGCLGEACKRKSSQYYARYRAGKKPRPKVVRVVKRKR